MKLRITSQALISTDNAAVVANQNSHATSSRSQRFNTADHTHSEITSVVPESENFKHEQPPWSLYEYAVWHSLVTKSQNLTDCHSFTIPSFLYDDLMTYFSAWMVGGTRTSLLDDIIETWTFTRSGKELARVLDGSRRWFIRLDQMSPKDSPLGGTLPSSTFRDVVTKICSSMRAYGCLQSAKEDVERKGTGQGLKVQLFLNPWNEEMDTAKEFRVFVPPPAARGVREPTVEDLRVSAISQYRWHSVFQQPYGFSLEHIVDCVLKGSRDVLMDIVAYMEAEFDSKMRNSLLKYGFSFDVALQPDGSLHMVEINPFGAMSVCGACLFNWVIDGRVLYGLEEGVFTVVLDEMQSTQI
jgi:hypothetical protein